MWPKIILITIVLLGQFGSDFLDFLFPTAGAWLFVVGRVLLVPLLVMSLAALFTLRWKLISIFAIVWGLAVLPYVGILAPSQWLSGQGFRVQTMLTNEYPSGCQLTEFVENNVHQSVGFCRRFDRGNYFDYVVYDTAGGFVLPVSQRSPEWKRMMSKATEEGVELREKGAYRLFGNFYAVYVDITELRG